MILHVLFRPWSYLTIYPRRGQKILIDWILPFVLSCISMAAIYAFVELDLLLSSGGLIEKITTFIQTLPGFYLAALSAIATFNKPDLDSYMAGEPLYTKIMYGGRLSHIQLTRRRFLSMMFAFLTIQAFIISLLGIVMPMSSNIHFFEWLVVISCFIFLFFVWQVLIVTVWGLYYLGDKIHTPNN